jgi:hypothetical protein
MNRLTSVEIFLHLQAHCHASWIAGRQFRLMPSHLRLSHQLEAKEAIEKLVREEVSTKFRLHRAEARTGNPRVKS